MRRLRRALGPLAVTWLLCQVVTVGLATAAFGFDAVAVALIECTCAHGTDHTDCPMHHPAAPSGSSFQQCVGQSDTALLGSILGQAGLVPAGADALPAIPPRAFVPMDGRTFVLRPAPPDPPPPRA
jgi:hypothetical protein